MDHSKTAWGKAHACLTVSGSYTRQQPDLIPSYLCAAGPAWHTTGLKILVNRYTEQTNERLTVVKRKTPAKA